MPLFQRVVVCRLQRVELGILLPLGDQCPSPESFQEVCHLARGGNYVKIERSWASLSDSYFLAEFLAYAFWDFDPTSRRRVYCINQGDHFRSSSRGGYGE